MDEVEAIKNQHFRNLKRESVIMIVCEGEQFRIEQWFPDGVAPSSAYATPKEAAARACQLLGLKEPITPQSWPEIAQIGGSGTETPPLHS